MDEDSRPRAGSRGGGTTLALRFAWALLFGLLAER